MNKVNVEIVTTRKQYLKKSFRSAFKREKHFRNGTIAIKKEKCRRNLDKPVYQVFAANAERILYVTGKCKASMKREIRSMEAVINKTNRDIIFAKYSCPAGESGYCNHIMALLFEIVDYSLHQLISIPEEKS